MCIPRVAPWIEKFCDSLGFWIYPGEISSFMKIAVDASQREIFGIIVSSVTSRQNMFNMQ